MAGSQALFPESSWWPLETGQATLGSHLTEGTEAQNCSLVPQVGEGSESEFKLATQATGYRIFPHQATEEEGSGRMRSPRTCVLLINWEGSFVPLNIQPLVPSPLTGHLSIAPSARIGLTHNGRSWGPGAHCSPGIQASGFLSVPTS